MTARGMYNNHTLSFAMEHRMSLLILQVPATKYTYTEKIDSREISKSYYRYTAVISENLYWQENPCTARLLVNTTDPYSSFGDRISITTTELRRLSILTIPN